MKCVRIVCAISGLAACGLCVAQSQPFFKNLGNQAAGYTKSHAFDVSGDGSVVVGRRSISGQPSTHAFRWTEQTGAINLPLAPGFGPRMLARSVSRDGNTVAGQGDFVACRQAFRWTQSTGMQALGVLPGSSCSDQRGMSGDGSVVVGTAGMPGFMWTQATGIQDIGLLPSHPNFPGCTPFSAVANDASFDGSVIVGSSSVACGGQVWGQAFRLTTGIGMEGIGFLPGGTFSSAAAASEDGSVIVGQGNSATSPNEMFRWTAGGGVVALGLPAGGTSNFAIDVSADGSVVLGWASGDPVGQSGWGPVIWDATNGTRRLADVLVNELGLSLNGWILGRAMGISADGRTIVGSGRIPSGDTHAWIAYLGEAPCYADCDQSTGPGILDIFDFLCFQDSFVNAEPYACDCDISTGNGICDVFDFLCFQNAFVAGCP